MYNGTWTNDATRGQCLEFDGLSTYVDIDMGNNAAALHDFHEKTIAAWAKRISTGVANESQGYIFRGGGSAYRVYLYFASGGSQRWRVDNEADITGGTAAVGTWYHYVGVIRDMCLECPGTMTLAEYYVNGVKNATTRQVYLHERSELSGPRLGCDSTAAGNNNMIHARIQDVRIYDYALSQNEITYLATDGGSGAAPNNRKMIMWYKLDETTGAIAHDSAPSAPVLSPADIANPETSGPRIVNLVDFATLASGWLTTLGWFP
jgi:hypothetical protein